MPIYNLMPILGINNHQRADQLQTEHGYYVQDSVNLNIDKQGKITTRPTAKAVSNLAYHALWQSPLHGDVFAILDGDWVKIDSTTWQHQHLYSVGTGKAQHLLLNNKVLLANRQGIFCYDGERVYPLTIATPPSPLATTFTHGGTLATGHYQIAIAWLREDGTESARSISCHCEVKLGEYNQSIDTQQGSIEIILPICLDPTIQTVNVYCTERNGSDLRLFGEYPITTTQVIIDRTSQLGRSAVFHHLSPMPTGEYIAYWNGRLLTTKSNIIRFSQAMNYHLHDERHDFIQLPQRIRFMQVVDGGIWVGLHTHVIFLSGDSPQNMQLHNKASQAPIANSAILVSADNLSPELHQGGSYCVLWLAKNGYVLGTATGQLIELHHNVIDKLTAQSAKSIIHQQRVISAII